MPIGEQHAVLRAAMGAGAASGVASAGVDGPATAVGLAGGDRPSPGVGRDLRG